MYLKALGVLMFQGLGLMGFIDKRGGVCLEVFVAFTSLNLTYQKP